MFFKSNRKAQSKPAPLVLNVAPTPGFFAGTTVATRYEWTDVADLKSGDVVLTAENGEQPITGMERGTLSVSATKAAAGQWPILIPEGALGNEKRIFVSPGTRIVIEDDVAGVLFGQACVSVRAENLIGFRGIARARVSKPMKHVTLVFDKPQTLVGEGGIFFDVADENGVHNFMTLDDRQARLLMRQMGEAERKSRARKVKAGWI